MLRVLFAVLLCATALTACNKAPGPPKSTNPQYLAGYRDGYAAGRADDRQQLCALFEKHQAAIATAIGNARLALIKSYCAGR